MPIYKLKWIVSDLKRFNPTNLCTFYLMLHHLSNHPSAHRGRFWIRLSINILSLNIPWMFIQYSFHSIYSSSGFLPFFDWSSYSFPTSFCCWWSCLCTCLVPCFLKFLVVRFSVCLSILMPLLVFAFFSWSVSLCYLPFSRPFVYLSVRSFIRWSIYLAFLSSAVSL